MLGIVPDHFHCIKGRACKIPPALPVLTLQMRIWTCSSSASCCYFFGAAKNREHWAAKSHFCRSASNRRRCARLTLNCLGFFFSPLCLIIDGSRKSDASLSNHDPRTAVQLRTALKRLKEIMEGKSQVRTANLTRPFVPADAVNEKNTSELWHLRACKAVCVVLCPLQSKDSDLKQYWMPDSQCKECYDCNEKFTTFRRRHHCRLCGQIFCSRCCNQEIPGKFMGYTGRRCAGKLHKLGMKCMILDMLGTSLKNWKSSKTPASSLSLQDLFLSMYVEAWPF